MELASLLMLIIGFLLYLGCKQEDKMKEKDWEIVELQNKKRM